MDFNGHKQMVFMKGRKKKNQIIAHVRQGGENNLLYLKLCFIRNKNIAPSSSGTITKNLTIITSNKWISKGKAVQVKLGRRI